MTGKTGFDLDILAYVDGHLDADPERRAAVERKLAAAPELAARVQAYRSQTAAIREAFDARADEPVPEHLLAALDEAPRRPARRIAAAAAVLLLTAAAGATGWIAGQRGGYLDGPEQAFIETDFHTLMASPAAGKVASIGAGQPLDWLSGEIALSLRAPDLEELGYAITDKRTVRDGGHELVRLTYGRADGRSFSLFLRPRWSRSGQDVTVLEEDGLSVAYWRDGPLSSAVASELPAAETEAIARRIRDVLRDPDATRPAVRPDRKLDSTAPAIADAPVPQAPEQTGTNGSAPMVPELAPRTMTN